MSGVVILVVNIGLSFGAKSVSVKLELTKLSFGSVRTSFEGFSESILMVL